MRGSPRIHHDGPESFPLSDKVNVGAREVPSSTALQQQTPVAVTLDAGKLRRLSFGGGSATRNKNMLPALDRPRGGGPGGTLVPLPVERPKFHHGDSRPKRPKACCAGPYDSVYVAGSTAVAKCFASPQ